MELRQYLNLLWKWAWLILLCMALSAGSAYLVTSRQPPTYQASTTLLITQGTASTTDYSAITLAERLASTYARMMTSRPVMDETMRRLNLSLWTANVSVTPVRDTSLLVLRVVDLDPALAKDIANTIPAVFAQQNEDLQLERYSSSKENLAKQLEVVNADIATAQAQLDTLRAAPTPDQAEISRANDALVQYRTTYANLLRSYEDIRVAEARLMDTVTVVESAALSSMVASKTMTNTLLAAVVGAMLAVGVAFLIEYLDDTVKTPDDVTRETQLSTFGAIVNFRKFSPNGMGPIVAARSKSSIAEAYRVLRTNLQFSAMGMGQAGALLLVTSAQPQEGKTTSLANLGVSLAQAGKRVLLVDTDLRRPSLHEQFELPNEVGVTSLLLEREADLERALQATPVEGLRVLTSGRSPANPAEVLSFPETAALLERLRPLADYVLLDSPPVLSVADASILAQRADGVLLVVEMGRTRTDMFRRAVAALESVKAHLMGVVLNKVSVRAGGYGYYHYYYYYSSQYADDTQEPTDKKRKAKRSWWARLFRRGRHKRAAATLASEPLAPSSAPAAPAAQAAEAARGRVLGMADALPALHPGPATGQADAAGVLVGWPASAGEPAAPTLPPAAPAASPSTLPTTAQAAGAGPAPPLPSTAPAEMTLAPRAQAPARRRRFPLGPFLLVLVLTAGITVVALAYLGVIRLPAARPNAQGYINQGRALFTIEDYPGALKSFTKALELDPNNLDAQLGLEKAQQYIQINALYNEALELVNANRCDQAIPKLEAVVEVDSWYQDANTLLIRCRRYQELDTLYLQASGLHNTGEWSKAVNTLQTIHSKDPAYRQSDVKQMMFECYTNDGKQRMATAKDSLDILYALQCLTNASNLFPNDAQALAEKELASRYWEGFLASTQQDWPKASSALAVLVSSRPDYAQGRAARLLCDCYMKQGDAYVAIGKREDAARQYRAILSISGCDPSQAQAKLDKLAPVPDSSPTAPGPIP